MLSPIFPRGDFSTYFRRTRCACGAFFYVRSWYVPGFQKGHWEGVMIFVFFGMCFVWFMVLYYPNQNPISSTVLLFREHWLVPIFLPLKWIISSQGTEDVTLSCQGHAWKQLYPGKFDIEWGNYVTMDGNCPMEPTILNEADYTHTFHYYTWCFGNGNSFKICWLWVSMLRFRCGKKSFVQLNQW